MPECNRMSQYATGRHSIAGAWSHKMRARISKEKIASTVTFHAIHGPVLGET